MTPLQKLHITIRTLGTAFDEIPITAIMKMLECEREAVVSGVEQLIVLEFITYSNGQKNKVVLTEKGKMAHVL